MRILFVHEKGGLWGGVEQNIILAADGLIKGGHTCALYCEHRSDRGFDKVSALFSSVYVMSDGGSLRAAVEEFSPEVLYVHKLSCLDEILGYSGSIRTVRMVHDHDLYCPRRHKYFFFNRRICSHAAGCICYADLAFLERSSEGSLRFTSIRKKLTEMRKNRSLDALVVGSRFMKEQLLKNGFSGESIHLLPPAVTFGGGRVSEVQDTREILYCGQLIRGKGVDLLLDALEQCSSDVRLHIVGTGNDEQMLKERTAAGPLAERVVFHGWVSHEDLSSLYDRSMFTIVPSRWPEPFGMVGLEAMLRRRPVIAFAVGGIPDWLEDGSTGYLVGEADTAAMSERIDELAGDIDLVRKMGERAFDSVHERFEFSAYIENLEKVLKGDS